MKKLPYIPIILFVCGLFISCNDNPSEPLYPEINYTLLSETLETAYQQDSQDKLNTFFNYWNEMDSPIDPEEFINLSQAKQEAYRLFINFYSPADLDRLTNGQHENFETEFRYVVIQNKLQIAVADTNPRFYYYRGVDITEYALDDFRPDIPDLEYPSVYLTEMVDSVIYNFLFTPDSTFTEDYTERADFLRSAMQLTPHHWINDYHKATMPHANQIIFNDDYTQALVLFRVFFQFGDAYFSKENGNWILQESRLTAIE